jgi:multiple sugar transport system permease protein
VSTPTGVKGGPGSRWARPRSSIAPVPKARQPHGLRLRTWSTAYIFVLPVLGLTVLFSIVPLIQVIRRSFYKGNIFDTDLKFAGWANYRAVFATGGGHALWVTLEYTVGFVLVCMLVGIGLALLLDMPLPGLSAVRALFIIPLVVPPVATAFIWFTLFQPDSGLFNRILGGLNLPQVTLDNPTVAMLAIIGFGAWQFFGEVVILYLAALKTLPRDVIEAAVMDGASAWQRLRHIRFPLLRPQTALVSVVATLNGLQAFTQIFVLTNGGPDGATQTALYYVYNQAFGLGASGSAGNADAMAVILFVISILVTIAQVVVVGRAARAVS